MKSIKFLLNQRWARDFFSRKVDQYFPDKQLIGCKVEPLKIYLNYKSIVVKYRLKLSDKEKNISEKNIMGKAETGQKIDILNDYSVTKFLWEHGLSDIIPKPLEYLPSFNLYLYEFVPGYFLQELSVKHKDQEFLDKIPVIIKALIRVHKMKIMKKDKILRRGRETEEECWRRDLKLVKQYWPSVSDKVSLWIQRCRFSKNKNKKHFNPELYRMTHGDFYSRNIIIDNSQVRLIDFSDSSLYDPLNDIGNFLINTELMFEYDFPKTYRSLMEELKKLFLKNYFLKKIKPEQIFKINYFILTNLIRIIAFAAMSEGDKKLPRQSSVVMDKLVRFGEEKHLILRNI